MEQIKTKIIATLGPASNNPTVIAQLIKKGVNVVRINMGHFKSKNDFENMIISVRELSDKYNKHIGILVDLAGPKIRLSSENLTKEIKKNKVYSLGFKPENDIRINIDIKFEKIISGKSFVKIDDGKIVFKVIELKENTLMIKALDDGTLMSKKGVNFPDIKLNVDSVTKTDKDHISLAIKHKVDWLALSFVRYEKDIKPILKIFKKKKYNIPVIAKIEKPEAIKNLDSIINVFNGILIARGDLGVEVSLAKLPGLQKTIIDKCQKAKKPVIVATQMLESMIENSSPTRAEVNDVANAVYESVDAVMLSGETAVGLYPVETVKIMREILSNAEKEVFKNYSLNHISVEVDKDTRSAIGEAVKIISQHLKIDAVVVMTESGSTGRIVSHYRPNKPIYALTPNIAICGKLCLIWGIQPILTKKFTSTDEMLVESEKILIKEEYLKRGDVFVLTSGVPVGITGSTNMLKIHKVGID